MSSLLVEAVRSGGLAYPVALFSANRRPVDAPFLEELAGPGRVRARSHLRAHDDGPGPHRAWDGERGHIDAAMLDRHLRLRQVAIYHVTGPAGLVGGLRAMLIRSGVDEDDIRTEGSTGY